MKNHITQYTQIVRSLLRRNVSRPQVIGYAIASFVGLTIVLVASQFYLDIKHAWDDKDTLLGENYLIVSKKVTGLGALTGGSAEFTGADLANVSQQPWAKEVGAFDAAQFDVTASVSMGGGKMATSLFLESVPDSFFDVRPREWNYKPGDVVPVIIPKDYLALYNFGYASAHGLPQLSENMMGMLPVTLSLSGNGMQKSVDARIVAFSSRLNTIAVPEAFLKEANQSMGYTSPKQPSRIIVKVNDKTAPAIKQFIESNNLEVAGDNTQSGNFQSLLNIVMLGVVCVGLVITILSFFILLLSLYLVLQKNRTKIHDLMLIGVKPQVISSAYFRLIATVNVIVTCASIASVVVAQSVWRSALKSIGVNTSSIVTVIIIAIAIMGLLTVIDYMAVKKKVTSNFRL